MHPTWNAILCCTRRLLETRKGPRECLNTTNHCKLFSRNGLAVHCMPTPKSFEAKIHSLIMFLQLSPKDQWLSYLEIWMHYVNFRQNIPSSISISHRLSTQFRVDHDEIIKYFLIFESLFGIWVHCVVCWHRCSLWLLTRRNDRMSGKPGNWEGIFQSGNLVRENHTKYCQVVTILAVEVAMVYCIVAFVLAIHFLPSMMTNLGIPKFSSFLWALNRR